MDIKQNWNASIGIQILYNSRYFWVRDCALLWLPYQAAGRPVRAQQLHQQTDATQPQLLLFSDDNTPLLLVSQEVWQQNANT
jgi:hypothetical protein